MSNITDPRTPQAYRAICLLDTMRTVRHPHADMLEGWLARVFAEHAEDVSAFSVAESVEDDTCVYTVEGLRVPCWAFMQDALGNASCVTQDGRMILCVDADHRSTP